MSPHCSRNLAIRRDRRSPRSAFAALGSAPLFLKPMLAALAHISILLFLVDVRKFTYVSRNGLLISYENLRTKVGKD